MSGSTYLLAGQASELERLALQSKVWEPSGRRLLEEIGDGRGARAVDIGCGVMGWLRLSGPALRVRSWGPTSMMRCSPSPNGSWLAKASPT